MDFLDKTGLAYFYSKITSRFYNKNEIDSKIVQTNGLPTNTVIGFTGETVPEGFEEIKLSGGGLPIGSGMDYFGTTAPENYMFADGTAISRTEYSELFEIIGTTYGAGDGSTTFNLPDKRERVSISAGSTDWYLGKTGGSLQHSHTQASSTGGTAITKAQLPSYNLYSASHTHTFNGTAESHNHGVTDNGHTHTYPIGATGGNAMVGIANSAPVGANSGNTLTSKDKTGISIQNKSVTPKGSNTGTTITVSSGGSGQAHTHTLGSTNESYSLPPYLVCNYIIKVK